MISDTCDSNVKLRDLSIYIYIRKNWIAGFWGADDWTVYRRSIRKNNDNEGFNNRLNKMAKPNMNMYSLIHILSDASSKALVMVHHLLSNGLCYMWNFPYTRPLSSSPNYIRCLPSG